jgi:hypothetical protein
MSDFVNDTRARIRQAAAIAELGYLAALRDDGPQYVLANRLRFDASRWLAGRLDPSRWSDSAELHLSVSDPEADERRALQRAQLIGALQKLAVAQPLTVEGKPEST